MGSILDKVMQLARRPWRLPLALLARLPQLEFVRGTGDYQGQVSLEFWIKQKLLDMGGNRRAYWPVHPTSKVHDVEHILVGVDAYPGLMQGCYITGKGGLTIGDYTQIGPHVVIVTSNHDAYDSRRVLPAPVRIGRYCWLGAGAKIMPGVTLGDWTVVGAGAVVTRSFPEGHCVLGGVPARVLRALDRERCVPFEHEQKFVGYIPYARFEAFRKRHLCV